MNKENFIITPSSQNERKQLFLETLINNTTKVSKVSDNSVLSGIASGISRIASKVEKDVSIYFSKLYPNYSSGEELDLTASLFGLPSRFSSSQSSTYLLVRGVPGTTYNKNDTIFSTPDGINFELTSSFTIPSSSYIYVLVRSVELGEIANVSPLSITRVSPEPEGHLSVFNESMSIGGRDTETDELFRRRIIQGINLVARNTLSSLEQLFIKRNNNILKIYHQGINDNGQVVIAVTTQNGIPLNSTEIDLLIESSSSYVALTDLRPEGRNFYGLEIRNMDFVPLDISLRVDFDGTRDYTSIRVDLQTKILKYLDWRYWNGYRIEWDTLLELCKSVKGIRYVQDEFFFPRVDIKVEKDRLPRLRGFRLMNLEGDIVSDFTTTEFSPLFYQNMPDVYVQQTILG